MYTHRPFLRKREQISASLSQATTVNHSVCSWRSPQEVIHARVVARRKDVTDFPPGV
jgi:hypothetical protein|tara:strand:- start:342 stop:512 length:171 start_codon:yes stop_codon:yes gene_type:complete